MYYGAAQSAIHHERFGALAADAAALVSARLTAAGIGSGVVVDLGCGSGIYAAAMISRGFDVVGVDISADMVALARANAPGASLSVGSAHDFEIPSGVVAVTALGEVLNYTTDARAGLSALSSLAGRVRSSLAPGGVFVFDVSTPGRAPGGVVNRFHVADDWALGMIATEAGFVLRREITIFARDEGSVSFSRVDETHVLALYAPDDVVGALQSAGFRVDVLDGYRDDATLAGWKVFVAQV